MKTKVCSILDFPILFLLTSLPFLYNYKKHGRHLMAKTLFSSFILLIMALTIASCGDSTNNATTATNPFTVAFPSDLAVASPTASTTTTSSLVLQGASVSSSASFAEKRAALDTILTGASIEDCDFNFSLTTNTESAACYGPTLTYANHPEQASGRDADTTDADSGSLSPNDTDGDGFLPIGDVGIWRENEGATEACTAAQLNKLTNRTASQVDSTVFAMASLICIANVNSLTIPTDGTTLDLTSYASSGFSENSIPVTVTSATLAAEAISGTSETTYTSTFAGTATAPPRNPPTHKFRLKHRNGDDGDTYLGKLSCTIATADGAKTGNCNVAEVTATGQTDAISIAYQKNSETIFTYELHSGNYCGDTGVDPYVSATDYTVDPEKKLNLSIDAGTDLLTGWANNFNFARYQLNINTGAGEYQSAWQAGRGDGYTRVLNVDLDSVSGGGNTGCGYFGFGSDIASSTGVGTIDGMICNWTGPGNTKTTQSLVQQQCMNLNTTSGIYESDSSTSGSTRLAISYAPTNSCDTTGLDPDGNIFQYSDSVTTVNTAVTNNLFPIADMPSISPPAPTNIDS